LSPPEEKNKSIIRMGETVEEEKWVNPRAKPKKVRFLQCLN